MVDSTVHMGVYYIYYISITGGNICQLVNFSFIRVNYSPSVQGLSPDYYFDFIEKYLLKSIPKDGAPSKTN